MEFASETDLYTVLNRNLSFFKGEMVAIKKVFSKEEAKKGTVDCMELWVHIYGDDLNVLIPNYIPKLLEEEKVGISLSEAQKILFRGYRGYKVRMLISLNQAVKDVVTVKHKLLGIKRFYLVYEKVTKICTYCGYIGHTKELCTKRSMMLRLKIKQQFTNNATLWSFPDQNIGNWVIDRNKIPIEQEYEEVKSVCNEEMLKRATGNDDGIVIRYVPAFPTINICGRHKRRRIIQQVPQKARYNKQQETMEMNVTNDKLSLNYKRAREAIPNSPTQQP